MPELLKPEGVNVFGSEKGFGLVAAFQAIIRWVAEMFKGKPRAGSGPGGGSSKKNEGHTGFIWS